MRGSTSNFECLEYCDTHTRTHTHTHHVIHPLTPRLAHTQRRHGIRIGSMTHTHTRRWKEGLGGWRDSAGGGSREGCWMLKTVGER
jgi:hypothetical protein